MDSLEPIADTRCDEDRIMSRAAGGAGFVHLHVHSAYSLLEGALPLKRLADLAMADRMPALGIADTGNLFGALEFAEKMAEEGIQPIVGCQVAVDFGDWPETRRAGRRRERPLRDIVLIAATEAGYWNLVRLVSDSFMRPTRRCAPMCHRPRLRRARRGLIALTGGPGGPVDQALAAGQGELAAARLDRLRGIFGDRLYVELQRHGTPSEAAVEPQLVDARLRARAAAGRHQRAVLPGARGLRGA